jgi:hypothetical protein
VRLAALLEGRRGVCAAATLDHAGGLPDGVADHRECVHCGDDHTRGTSSRQRTLPRRWARTASLGGSRSKLCRKSGQRAGRRHAARSPRAPDPKPYARDGELRRYHLGLSMRDALARGPARVDRADPRVPASERALEPQHVAEKAHGWGDFGRWPCRVVPPRPAAMYARCTHDRAPSCARVPTELPSRVIGRARASGEGEAAGGRLYRPFSRAAESVRERIAASDPEAHLGGSAMTALRHPLVRLAAATPLIVVAVTAAPRIKFT